MSRTQIQRLHLPTWSHVGCKAGSEVVAQACWPCRRRVERVHVCARHRALLQVLHAHHCDGARAAVPRAGAHTHVGQQVRDDCRGRAPGRERVFGAPAESPGTRPLQTHHAVCRRLQMDWQSHKGVLLLLWSLSGYCLPHSYCSCVCVPLSLTLSLFLSLLATSPQPEEFKFAHRGKSGNIKSLRRPAPAETAAAAAAAAASVPSPVSRRVAPPPPVPAPAPAPARGGAHIRDMYADEVRRALQATGDAM